MRVALKLKGLPGPCDKTKERFVVRWGVSSVDFKEREATREQNFSGDGEGM